MPSPSSPSPDSGVARGAAIAAIAVLGSRVLGLVREQVFAVFFGASREYDAFLTAFRIPNLLRDLLAEGALSAAFVTTFSKTMARDGKEAGFRLANTVANTLALLLIFVVLAGIFFAEPVVQAIAIGFDAEKTAMAAELTQIMMPFILFVALAALAMGMLNAQHYFALPQSASTFFNVTSIVVGLGTAFLLAPEYMTALWDNSAFPSGTGAPARAMTGMAVGTLAGGLVQWLVQMPTLRRTGYRWQPRLDWKDPGFRAVLVLMGPALIGAAAVQINVFVNSNFASLLGDKPISWLNYSFRLMQFPIGVFGVAIMTASLPALSRHLAAGDHPGFRTTLTQSLELALLLTLPAAVGLAVLGEPIIRLVYEHGRFDHADTLATAAALGAYAFGLPGYAALKIVQPAFISLDDAKTPMYVSLGAVAGNAALNALFVFGLGFGHVGLAAATAAMATVNVVVLLVILRRRLRTTAALDARRFAGQVLRIGVAAAVMGAAAWGGYRGLQRAGLAEGSLAAGIEVVLLLPTAVAVYAAVCRVLGIAAFDQAAALVTSRLRRHRA